MQIAKIEVLLSWEDKLLYNEANKNGILCNNGGIVMGQYKAEEYGTTLEQIAGKLSYYYKNGWDSLFDDGLEIQAFQGIPVPSFP